MKLANVIIPAKEFLFDTWYGALTVWCGASTLLVAMLLLDLPFAGRIWWSSIAPYVGYALLSASWRVDAQTMAQRTAHAFPATSSATGAKKLFSETRKMPRSFGSM